MKEAAWIFVWVDYCLGLYTQSLTGSLGYCLMIDSMCTYSRNKVCNRLFCYQLIKDVTRFLRACGPHAAWGPRPRCLMEFAVAVFHLQAGSIPVGAPGPPGPSSSGGTSMAWACSGRRGLAMDRDGWREFSTSFCCSRAIKIFCKLVLE